MNDSDFKQGVEIAEELSRAKKALIAAWTELFYKASFPAHFTKSDAEEKARTKYRREIS